MIEMFLIHFYCFQYCDSLILIKASASDIQVLLLLVFLVELRGLRPFRW